MFGIYETFFAIYLFNVHCYNMVNTERDHEQKKNRNVVKMLIVNNSFLAPLMEEKNVSVFQWIAVQ